MDGKLDRQQKELAQLNIRLAYHRSNIYFKKYSSYNLYLDKDDFDSFALEGLCEAARRYDDSKNIKFSTFAVSYIDNYIKSNVYAENSTIRVPSSSQNKDKMKYYRYIALKNALVTSNVEGCVDSDNNVVNLDSLYLCGANEKGFSDIEDSLYIDFIMDNLSEKDKSIFNLLLEGNNSMSSIAESLGIHLNTVCRRRKHIANKIKTFSKRI